MQSKEFMREDLAYLGHPVLRKKALPVHRIDHNIQELIRTLKHVVSLYRGLGLAAPQIGAQVAIFIACFPEKNEEGTIVPGKPHVFINPKLTDPSEETWTEEEGCLSIPKFYRNVSRPVAITITSQDETGTWNTERLSGWPAKIIMHENDHLNGVLFIDRLPTKEKRESHQELTELKKRYKQHNSHLPIWHTTEEP